MENEICCTDIIGGEIYITATIEGMQTIHFEAMGEVRIQSAAIERTAGASSGGTVWVVEASRPIRAVLSFVNRCMPDPLLLFCRRCKLDVIIVEKSRGNITHTLRSALVVGAPEKNLSTGEVSGMEIVCSGYNYDIDMPMTVAAISPPDPTQPFHCPVPDQYLPG